MNGILFKERNASYLWCVTFLNLESRRKKERLGRTIFRNFLSRKFNFLHL